MTRFSGSKIVGAMMSLSGLFLGACGLCPLGQLLAYKSCEEVGGGEVCSDAWDPVCGEDERSYRNACVACQSNDRYSVGLCRLETGSSFDNETDCESAGGVWGQWFFLSEDFCRLRASDAGSPCTSDVQCEGFCFCRDDTNLIGECSEFRALAGGCYCLMEGFGQHSTLCID